MSNNQVNQIDKLIQLANSQVQMSEIRDAQRAAEEEKLDVYSFSAKVTALITNPQVSTIVFNWAPITRDLIIFYRENDKPNQVIETSLSYAEYLDKMNSIFNIQTEFKDDEAKYNQSISCEIEGTDCRVFALTPPTSEFLTVIVSTTKTPPATWGQPELDPIFKEVCKGSFIIIGQTGSGKTYLMNYLMSKFFPKDALYALIQEFDEIVPVNSQTIKMTVIPPKPGQPHMMRYLVEQTNLMRLDRFVVGEVKGVEALPTLENMSSGTKGAFTFHGLSVRHGLQRLQSICFNAGAEARAIDEYIAKGLNYAIFCKDHRVKQIVKMVGTSNNGNYATQVLYNDKGYSDQPQQTQPAPTSFATTPSPVANNSSFFNRF